MKKGAERAFQSQRSQLRSKISNFARRCVTSLEDVASQAQRVHLASATVVCCTHRSSKLIPAASRLLPIKLDARTRRVRGSVSRPVLWVPGCRRRSLMTPASQPARCGVLLCGAAHLHAAQTQTSSPSSREPQPSALHCVEARQASKRLSHIILLILRQRSRLRDCSDSNLLVAAAVVRMIRSASASRRT